MESCCLVEDDGAVVDDVPLLVGEIALVADADQGGFDAVALAGAIGRDAKMLVGSDDCIKFVVGEDGVPKAWEAVAGFVDRGLKALNQFSAVEVILYRTLIAIKGGLDRGYDFFWGANQYCANPATDIGGIASSTGDNGDDSIFNGEGAEGVAVFYADYEG